MNYVFARYAPIRKHVFLCTIDRSTAVIICRRCMRIDQSACSIPIKFKVISNLGQPRTLAANMVKHCAYGQCNSDTRYPIRIQGVRFCPFPKPKTNREKCLRWIRACGRPYYQLDTEKITKDTYVCSKHFHDDGPTEEYPDPVPADGRPPIKSRKRRRTYFNQHAECNARSNTDVILGTETEVQVGTGTEAGTGKGVEADMETEVEPGTGTEMEPGRGTGVDNQTLGVDAGVQTEGEVYSALDMLTYAVRIRKLEEENLQLKQQLEESKQQLKRDTNRPFTVESANMSCIKKVFEYYTGLTFCTFMTLFTFLFPNKSSNPVHYTEKRNDVKKKNL